MRNDSRKLHMETPNPETLITLVQRRVDVEMSSSTALRGKHIAFHDNTF